MLAERVPTAASFFSRTSVEFERYRGEGADRKGFGLRARVQPSSQCVRVCSCGKFLSANSTGQAVVVEENPDPQVPEGVRRRTYTAKYKRDILTE